MKLLNTTTAALLFFPLLLSCTKVDDIPGEDLSGKSPILVSADNVSSFTRAYIPSGMYDNFKVFAVYEQEGRQTVAMNGYEVRFVSDDWKYETESQPLMYWNSYADRYLFTAGAPIESVKEISATSMTLHLSNNTTGSAMAAEPLEIKYGSSDFGNTVNLRFGYAHCRVCVAFVKDATTAVSVQDIQLTPALPIATEAEKVYAYDWSKATSAVTSTVSVSAESADALTFATVTIPANTKDAVVSETRHYCVPNSSNPTSWTVSLTCDGERKTATFENTKPWESGKNYIYVFSLTEKSPKLLEVISQNTFFDCNDIVPGGEFSNTDMTE